METEITYLSSEFKNVIICPQEKGEKYYATLPQNVVVMDFNKQGGGRIRSILKSYALIILKYYHNAIMKSPHRWKYLRQLRFTWNTLMGFISRAEWIMVSQKAAITDSAEGVVFYSYWFNEWASGLALARRKGLRGRFVVRAHGYDYDEQQNGRGYFPFRESEMNQFNAIFQISEYGAGLMRKQYPASKNIVVSRLGAKDGGCNAGGKEGEKFQIVSCSNFVRVKRISLLIDILALLKVPFYWTHFGGGSGMEEAMEYAAGKLSTGTYHFAGHVRNTDVVEHYRQQPVDLFINTSILEGIPVSMMEAIAAGIPVAGFNICGIPEIISANSGLLLDTAEEPLAWSRKIEGFLIRNTRDAEFRSEVKAFWKNNFDSEKNYSEFIHLLKL